MRPTFAVLPLMTVLIAGCSLSPTATPVAEPGSAIQGSVHGGQQPVVGAHVYLFAANTTGYGNASVSLLSAGLTGHSDSVGAYVLTASDGTFSISGDYNCTTNTQVYLYALGGNPGAGANSAAGFLAVLGNCPAAGNFAAATPFIAVNEVSTMAAAYALSGFAKDATHVSSSGTALAQIGIANAFANAANITNLSTGTALATTPNGNGTVPQAQINTLANILATCVNSTGPTSNPCQVLITNIKSSGSTGTNATDTATMAIYLAHNPASNVSAIFGIVTPQAPFAPTLPSSSVPNDFSLGITFTGGGMSGPSAIAIDGSGNAWVTNSTSPSSPSTSGNLTEISSTGTFLSGNSGFTGGGLVITNAGTPGLGVAIDSSENVWIANSFGGNIVKFSSAGVPDPASPFSATGLIYPQGIAIDVSGNVWVTDSNSNSLFVLTNTGSQVAGTPYTGGGMSVPGSVAIDASGNAWVANAGNVEKLSNSGTILSGSGGYISGSIGDAVSVAVNGSGNVWIANSNEGITEISSTGSVLAVDFGSHGVNNPVAVAMDGAGSVWSPNAGSNALVGASSSSAFLTGTTGFQTAAISGPTGVAVDGSGNIWVSNSTTNSVLEIIGAATPVVTPIATAVKNATLGSRP